MILISNLNDLKSCILSLPIWGFSFVNLQLTVLHRICFQQCHWWDIDVNEEFLKEKDNQILSGNVNNLMLCQRWTQEPQLFSKWYFIKMFLTNWYLQACVLVEMGFVFLISGLMTL